MSNRTKLIIASCLLVLYSGVILILTLLSSENVEKIMLFPLQDKIAHLLMFAMWGLLLGLLLNYTSSQSLTVPAFIGGVFFSATDEILQQFASGRSVDFIDWVFDALGITLGMLFFYYILKARGLTEDAS